MSIPADATAVGYHVFMEIEDSGVSTNFVVALPASSLWGQVTNDMVEAGVDAMLSFLQMEYPTATPTASRTYTIEQTETYPVGP